VAIPRTRQTLLEKLKDCYDEKSWNEFQKIYAPYILKVLRAMNMNSHDCQDLQQDVLLIVWKSLPKFNYQADRGSFRSWISTVSRREAIRFIKKRQKSFISNNEERTDYYVQTLKSIEAPDVDHVIKQEWEKFISEKAWDNISDRFSEKILGIFQKLSTGVDIATLAQDSGLSESSIYVYKKRVLNTLQKEILKLNRELG
jgi:RNA polymerase sigma factor (sigma-70 family)